MLEGALIVCEAETLLDQGEIEACAFGLINGTGRGHRRTIAPTQARRNQPLNLPGMDGGGRLPLPLPGL